MSTRTTTPPAARRPTWQPLFESLLIVTAGVLLVALTREVAAGVGGSPRGGFPTLAAGLVLGILAADFASGTLHWFCDRFFSERTPIVGRALIAPFRDHHDDPQGIVRHGLLELHGNSCLPVIALLLLERTLALPLLFQSGVLFFAAASLATNQFHKWAHQADASRGVRWLQRHGLILSPQVHGRHHRGGFDEAYCMTTGWLNPLLDRLAFFSRLERAIRARNTES